MVFHFAIKSTKYQQKILGHMHDPICVHHSFEVLHHKSDEEQGWRSGESTRLHHKWPGLESWRRRHMWVEFVVGSLLYSEIFLYGYSGFTLSLKTNTSNKFQFDLERKDKFQRALKNS